MKYQTLFLCFFAYCIQATNEPREILKSRIKMIHFKDQKAFIKISSDRKTVEVLCNDDERVLATLKEGTFFHLQRGRYDVLYLYACVKGERLGFATPIKTLFVPKEDRKELYWWMLDEKCGSVIPYLH